MTGTKIVFLFGVADFDGFVAGTREQLFGVRPTSSSAAGLVWGSRTALIDCQCVDFDSDLRPVALSASPAKDGGSGRESSRLLARLDGGLRLCRGAGSSGGGIGSCGRRTTCLSAKTSFAVRLRSARIVGNESAPRSCENGSEPSGTALRVLCTSVSNLTRRPFQHIHR